MSKDYSKEELQNNLSQIFLISIGTFTSEELKKLDVPYTVSQIHTVAGAFDTLKNL
jgi:uroporphyrinogen-III synthase